MNISRELLLFFFFANNTLKISNWVFLDHGMSSLWSFLDPGSLLPMTPLRPHGLLSAGRRGKGQRSLSVNAHFLSLSPGIRG